MGFKLRWLLLLSCLYISVEAHAYGYRPQQQPVVRPSAYVAKRPSTYSYVRPAARGIPPQQPAVKYVLPATAVPKYVASTATTTAIPPVATASYKSGDYAAGTLLPTTTAAPYTAEVVYYTTEPVYYTTTPPSYYAERIYYSTELPAASGTATESPYYTGSQYTYVDAGTYFGEDVSQQVTESPNVYASSDYVPAVPGDYASAGAGGYAPAVPPDYATAVEAHYMDAGYNVASVPSYYPYTDTTEYYAVAAGTEQYAQNAGYYTASPPVFAETAPTYAGSVPVYDGQQNYVAGSDAYVTDVSVNYYYANLAADTATFSPFSPANVQYVA
ncbi:uncharacterized protein LOC130703796 isoform X2 [Daphnia carinata]|uniref:uncharacterized protein LOC130703796 isoform X2 n=1 Tax=Daphnia carinata TaxID=120202 RepID=UPI00257D5B7E|nr:uncharacterized protein LOC130703796 isoform X2 [Daphnia carinata]